MADIRKLSSEEPAEVAYYDGYRRGHLDTARMMSRRSVMYLFVGAFFGTALMVLVASTGLLDRLTAETVVEDPALEQEKPKEYVKAIEWAKRFTVGIVAETPERQVRTYFGIGRLPGQRHVGSGIVLNEEGYVLTNAHVIPDDAARVNVVLGDNMYQARFVGHRPEYDLAVIKIAANELAAASLGDSDKVEQGDIAIAIGAPHGLFHTATEGIISYVGRRGTGTGSLVPNYLQTSAAINHGNSGGPLIDLQGRVIGINTWKLSDDGQDSIDGIGFAIPINVARRVFDAIVGDDDPTRDEMISSVPRSVKTAFLGVEIDPEFRPESDAGARVRSVIYDSAADDAGLKAGDLIIRVNEHGVTNLETLRDALQKFEPGDRIKLTYIRNGDAHSVEVTLRE